VHRRQIGNRLSRFWGRDSTEDESGRIGILLTFNNDDSEDEENVGFDARRGQERTVGRSGG
jgi:hypothetical protein